MFTLKLSTPKTSEEIASHAKEKEYQAFIYRTNQVLNRLNEGIVSLGIQHEKMYQKHQSLHNNLSIDFENHISEVGLKIGRAFSCIDDFRSDLGEIQLEVKSQIDTSNREFVTKQDLERMASYIHQQMKLLDLSFKDLKNFVESELMNLKASLDGKIQAASNEVKKVMPKVDPVKEALESKINVFYTDLAGLTKEIARIKEAVMYGEKKFENLYTLIERLQKGVPNVASR